MSAVRKAGINDQSAPDIPFIWPGSSGSRAGD